MSSLGWVSRRNAVLSRFVVSDRVQWHGLMGRMRRGLANPPRAPRPPAVPAFAEGDAVRTQRELALGARRIACGAPGRVVALHVGRPLVEVAFGEVRLTLATYELLAEGGAGSGNRTRASSLGS